MDELDLQFSVTYRHRIFFTAHAFAVSNALLSTQIGKAKVLVVCDAGLIQARPDLLVSLLNYARHYKLQLTREPMVLTGGEAAKRDTTVTKGVLAAIEADRICRHSYVLAIGGGALLDAVGFAAATAHRGVRLIRMPSTTLGQADAGVGVKNGINTFGKKNFTGAFAVPAAVINDSDLLTSLDLKGRRDGLVEAVKVALLKDRDFFAALEADASDLVAGNLTTLVRAIRRSAELHARHITSMGDPFEQGSARPLDLGHWAAHRLESMTQHRLTHGEAVAVGLALDVVCARNLGLFVASEARRVLSLLRALGFKIYVPELHQEGGRALLIGLEEFREHLGGQLTLVLPQSIGQATEVHALAEAQVRAAADELQKLEASS